jgi:two-component system sensor histidine kinase RegB
VRFLVTDAVAKLPPPAAGATPDLRPSGELAPELALPWVIKLRYGLAVGQLVTVLFATFVLEMTLPVGLLSIPPALIAASNLLLRRGIPRTFRHPRSLFALVFFLDTLCLTASLGLSGGTTSPFSLLYLVQITLSAVILDRAWTFGLGLVSISCFALLFWVYLPVPGLAIHHAEGGASLHLVGMWLAFAIAALLIGFFVGHVAETLRQRERDVIAFQDRLARQEKYASLVTLAAGAAHELSTPLGTIAIVSKELEHAAARNDATGDDARLIRAEVERCRVILQRMSARGAEPVGETPELVDLCGLAESACRQLTADQRAALQVTVAPDARHAILPPEAASQALGALLRNACEADPSLNVSLAIARRGDRILFVVQDHGVGMSSDVLRRVAEPFFTYTQPGDGMGLGVFMVRLFDVRLGGELVYDSEPGGGTTVTLELPGSPVAAPPHHVPA